MTPFVQIARARRLALTFHGHDKRRGGEPYMTHLEAVAAAVADHLKPVALLHDILEKGAVIRNLTVNGIHPCVIDAVVAMTKQPGEPYMDYIERLAENPMALVVKIADIRHNMDGSPNADRRKKYPRALEYLLAKQIASLN